MHGDKGYDSNAFIAAVESRGAEAVVPPKKNRGETVSLVLTLHYGNEESLKGQTTAAGMLPALMMAGTKKHDRQALRDELDQLGVTISPGLGGGGRGGGRRGGRGGEAGTPGQLTFSLQGKRSTLPAGFGLLVPRAEGRKILATTFVHNKFPYRAPEDRALRPNTQDPFGLLSKYR